MQGQCTSTLNSQSKRIWVKILSSFEVLTIKSKKVYKIIQMMVNKAEEFCGSELSVAEGVMWSNMNINESLAENK